MAYRKAKKQKIAKKLLEKFVKVDGETNTGMKKKRGKGTSIVESDKTKLRGTIVARATRNIMQKEKEREKEPENLLTGQTRRLTRRKDSSNFSYF